MNNLRILNSADEIDKDKWDEFVNNHPNGNFFQSRIAFDFFKDLEGYLPLFFTAVDADSMKGILIAILMQEKGIKGYFSRRCIVWGGPLCYDIRTADLLLKELIKIIKNKTIYIEFRNLFDLSMCKDVFEKNGLEFKEHYNFNLEILNLEGNLKKLNKSRRWEINKGLKEGAKIVEAKDLNEVKTFYLILQNLYKGKVKKPLPNFNFFKQFYLNPSLGKYFLVEYHGRIIGGTMCPIFKDIIYEWYECSLVKEFKNLYPGSLATWAPIEYAVNNGLKYFDFMGAGGTNDNYGVREFKSKFGGELINHGRYLRINKPILYSLGKFVLNLKKSLS